jgi:hypothetical protein
VCEGVGVRERVGEGVGTADREADWEGAAGPPMPGPAAAETNKKINTKKKVRQQPNRKNAMALYVKQWTCTHILPQAEAKMSTRISNCPASKFC